MNPTTTETEWQRRELATFQREQSRPEGYFTGTRDFEAAQLDSADHLKTQLEWIENGSYGAGACLALQRLLARQTPRMNTSAHVGAFLLSCLYGRRFTGWRRLSPAAQSNVRAAVASWLAEPREWAATLDASLA